MRIGIYARVSTQRQAQADGLTQQLDRLLAHALRQGWTVQAEHVFRDDGYSGASLKRPGLERLRDRAALRELDRVLITAPDRLARNYVHQVLLLEEISTLLRPASRRRLPFVPFSEDSARRVGFTPAALARASALSVFSHVKLPFTGGRPKWPWRAVCL